jgi:flagellar hook assembly protein FlgD
MVTVYIFDAKGSLIKTLENGYQPKGSHKITWNGTNQSNMEMPAGMYFYNIKTDDQILMNKMVIIR